MAYEITQDYIRTGNSRPGQRINTVSFIVSHDTGNPGSTAYGNRNYFDRQQPSASAHTFIDDKYILEIIPLTEIAYHVRSNVTADNRLYGANANSAAIGVELCHGGKINFDAAYDRYVWYHAYLCDRFNLDPKSDIVAHATLDPSRRTDPIGILRTHGISWSMFIDDVTEAFRNFNGAQTPSQPSQPSKPPQQTAPAPNRGTKGTTVKLPIGEGASGAFVRDIQQQLIKAGYRLPRYGADSVFGEETENAVMRFQRDHNLAVDGLVGQVTLSKLQQVNQQRVSAPDFPLPSGVLRRGDQGESVRQLQRALKQINYNPGTVDGIYGPRTEDAVRRFQSMYAALKDDGIYGPNTRKYIRMELDD
ncbi:N-acetylmuramoyl-L-alanine amidase [Metabacillus halosaccharovorans]|nr:N-acetylmuramoyl-L-alanine amidase [Metabacillus halosaccharovorans]